MSSKKIYGYLANQLGFSEIGNLILYENIIPNIKKTGIEVLEPFSIVKKHMNLNYILKDKSYDGRVDRWREFGMRVGAINKKSMKKSKIMIPILDGGHTVDDGVANEIGHYNAKRYGPIIALRTDFRLADNIGNIINGQIEHDIIESGGKICTKLDNWYKTIEKTYKGLIK